MPVVTVIAVAIDTDAPLGPQVAAARAQGVAWKLIVRATGFTERHLRNLAAKGSASSGFSERRDAPSRETLSAAT